MQNKGAIRLFAILLALVCVYQLSFTVVSRLVERKATEYANNPGVVALSKKLAKNDLLKERYYYDSIAKAREKYYFDSISTTPVYNLLIRKYTYKECKERELNLGLDLKGGMNVTMEISVVDILRAMSNNSQDSTFNKAIKKAVDMQKLSQQDFITLFGQAFESIDPKARLSSPSIFGTIELKDRINNSTTNEEILKIIREEADGAIDRTFNILRTRIDAFGVTQPNIQKIGTYGRILVELPGVKEPERARKLLQAPAKLEFWLTYENSEIYNYLSQANDRLKDILENKDTAATKADSLLNKLGDSAKTAKADSLKKKKDTTKKSIAQKLGVDTSKKKEGLGQNEKWEKENPLFAVLRPALVQAEKGYNARPGPVVGYSAIKDTAKVNRYLKMTQIKSIFPRDLKLLWMVKPEKEMPDVLELVALKSSGRDGKAALEGDVVIDARQDFGQNNSNEVSMTMNSEGASIWKRLTGENIKKCVAIVLDNYVYSAPVVQDEIPNGRSQITGNFTLNEAKDLANVLKAGKLPAPARIVEEAVVGPTLGKESINYGFISFVIALLLVLMYMVFYYSNAGWAADLALFANFFFIMGILASLGAVLTLPGIAGIVITMGMAVDANVIIYERVREELAIGKGMRLAVSDGFKNSYSAIIDANVTTLLVGVILYIFGTGPVRGFATTLSIGILTTLFTAIFISRLVFERRLNKNLPVRFYTKLTEGAFKKVNFNFLGSRKLFYVLSCLFVAGGMTAVAVRGFDIGVDFKGGRTYVVRFAKEVKTPDVKEALKILFVGAPEVKTFGTNDQVKITTKYMIENNSVEIDNLVEGKLYEGLKPFLGKDVTKEVFKSKYLMSSQKVGPTVARDIVIKAIWAIIFALVGIALYVLLRFNKWQFALGAFMSLFHDTLILISCYALLWGVLPFSFEVDQAFIAAILTVLGYSINDTVIIFDRIREYMGLHKKQDLKKTVNDALNSTLSRTINTVLTVVITLIAMFIFGGEVIRGFIFAMLVGILVGTYSSLFIATPLFYDTYIRKLRKEERKAMKNPMVPAQ